MLKEARLQQPHCIVLACVIIAEVHTLNKVDYYRAPRTRHVDRVNRIATFSPSKQRKPNPNLARQLRGVFKFVYELLAGYRMAVRAADDLNSHVRMLTQCVGSGFGMPTRVR